VRQTTSQRGVEASTRTDTGMRHEIDGRRVVVRFASSPSGSLHGQRLGSHAPPARTVTRFATGSAVLGYPAGVKRVAQRSRTMSCAITIAVALAMPSTAVARGLEPPSTAAPTAAPAAAAPAATAPAASDAAAVDMDQVKRIYADGKTKYDTHDYSGAIAAWTEALSMLPAVTENREIRNDLFYNIATAQEKAYDIDRDAAHLRSARALLVDFVDEYKRLYTPTEEAKAEVARVKERIAGLDNRIAEAERSNSGPSGVVNAEKKRRDGALHDVFAADPQLHRQYKSGRGMIIGGSVALGIGALSLIIAASAIAELNRHDGARGFDRGIAIGFGGVGIAGVVAGAVLLGVGVPKRKRALETARSRVVLAPTLGPMGRGGTVAGLGLVGRF
jgi:hypothetical protein